MAIRREACVRSDSIHRHELLSFRRHPDTRVAADYAGQGTRRNDQGIRFYSGQNGRMTVPSGGDETMFLGTRAEGAGRVVWMACRSA